MAHENVHKITEGQKFELGAMCVKAILKLSDMPFETGKRWIGNQNAFVEALRSALIPLRRHHLIQKGCLRLILPAHTMN